MSQYPEAHISVPEDNDQPTDHDTLHVPGGVLHLKPSTAAAFERAPTELAWEADKRLTTTG